MKIVGIFDNREEQLGFKLSGIETNVAKNPDELNELLSTIKQDKEVGILVINQEIYNMAKNDFDELEKKRFPLLIKYKREDDKNDKY